MIVAEVFAPEVESSLKRRERLVVHPQSAKRFADRAQEGRFHERLVAERLIEVLHGLVEDVDDLDRAAIPERIGPAKGVDQELECLLGAVLFVLCAGVRWPGLRWLWRSPGCAGIARPGGQPIRSARRVRAMGPRGPGPASATPTAAAHPATSGWWRRTQRRARSRHGSDQAETGSSASQRSMSTASPRADWYRSARLNRHRAAANRIERRGYPRLDLSWRLEPARLNHLEHLIRARPETAADRSSNT